MVRRAHVQAGKVVDISIVEQLADGEIDGTNARIGDSYVDSAFVTPPFVSPVPAEVTPRQFRLALDQVDLLDTVEAAIAQADKATRITWEFGIKIVRDDPLLATMAAALNITGEQLDDLFRLAATL